MVRCSANVPACIVIRWCAVIVAVLVTVSPAMAQEQPADEKTGAEVREFDLWLDDETEESTDETDESNGRPLLKLDIEGLPEPEVDSPEVEETDTGPRDIPEIDIREIDDPNLTRPANLSKKDRELIAELRREVRSMRREMGRLRSQVEDMAARMDESESAAATEPVFESEVHAEAEEKPFNPFWLPQP